MIAFARNGDKWTVHVRGPETRATHLTCPEGWEFFGVELQFVGAYLPLFPPSGLANLNDALLPTLSGDRILLDNRDWEMPTKQNVDVFVNRLVRAGLLIFDPLVEEIRHGERPRAMSERIAQIRFRRAVGVSRRARSSSASSRHSAPRSSSRLADRSPRRSSSVATTTSRSSRGRCDGPPATPRAS
ncbi:hypothetical protein [Fodinicola feengrottensis]|uniref:hypothetical protein n=1 Tax=Fodinicola feengrottensis TaxID=435914 RepID=UPI0013D656E9|nr:hypothetical protein [Fodinicola feengrottensis]